MSKSAHNLSDLLDGVADQCGDGDVSIRDVLTAFGRRSHGPLLFVPGFLAATPIGAIPGVDIGAALLVVVISVQMIFFPGAPWLPRRITDIELPRETVDRAVDLALPTARVIDRYLKRRMEWLLNPAFVYVVAALSCAMALLMIPLAFVPFAAILPALAIALYGLSLTSEDGVVALLAVGFTAASIATGLYLAQEI